VHTSPAEGYAEVGIQDTPDTIEGSTDTESTVRSAATLISAFAITGVAHGRTAPASARAGAAVSTASPSGMSRRSPSQRRAP